jgi:cell division protein FtsB
MIKIEIKKLTNNSEKMKEQINLLTRENEFLKEMIEFTSKSFTISL